MSIWTDSGDLLANQAVVDIGDWTEIGAGDADHSVRWHHLSCHWPLWSECLGLLHLGLANHLCQWHGRPERSTTAYGDSFPVQVYTNAQGPLVDLRYQVVTSNSIAISPSSSGAFGSGVWSGNVTVGQAATNVVLKADDGAGHVALSSPFNVVTTLLLLSPQRLGGGQFQFTVSSAPGQRLEILASTNLLNWTSVTNMTNTTGTTNFTDPATDLVQRFYRAHQLP